MSERVKRRARRRAVKAMCRQAFANRDSYWADNGRVLVNLRKSTITIFHPARASGSSRDDEETT